MLIKLQRRKESTMCFELDPKHPEPKKAKRDIRCYKIVDRRGRSFVSPYRYKPYFIGRTHYAIGCLNWERIHNVEPVNGVISAGIHTYSTKNMALCKKSYSNVVLCCLIPCGTEYCYHHIDKEYVSTKIKVIKEVKP
jgi:hypothetical protein